MNIFALAVIVCLVAILVDYCWARYIMAASKKQKHKAAFWSASIMLTGGINVLAYTANAWMLIPAAIGAYIGTFVAVSE